jgi:iron(III) transport system permease protein
MSARGTHWRGPQVTTSSPALLAPTATRAARPRRRRHGGGLVALGALIAVVLLSPLWLLALDVSGVGWHEIHQQLFRALSLDLLRNTVALTAGVVAISATVGVAAAWCTERTRVPGRRLWRVVLVLPVAVPDEVSGYAWHTLAPNLNPFAGATLVMALTTYPFVYLPVAAALRKSDPAMEDTARSLGAGAIRTFARVTLPLIRTAVIGGCVLVALTLLSEYGSFEILRYQTFTTQIFTVFQFNPDAAGALSLPLVALALLVLGIDGAIPRRVVTRSAPRRLPLAPGWSRRSLLCAGLLAALVGLGVAFPIATVVYWIAQSHEATLPATATLSQATWNSLAYSGLGAAAAVSLALPVAMMSFRGSTAVRATLERSTFITLALPGVVIALSLVYFATRFAYGLYETSGLLIAAYAIMHFPLALVCVKTSVVQTQARLVDVGHSLGRGRVAVFLRVTLPLLAPGLLAGFCLVFLMAVTELTATLVLAPIGVMTLATQFWAFQSAVSYGAAAPYALVMLALAVIPAAVLAVWFDRGPNALPRMTP